MVDKHSLEYYSNVDELHLFELDTPMTLPERNSIRGWVIVGGHEIDSNPWSYTDENGYPLNYLQAYRLHFGDTRGSIFHWRDPDSLCYPD